MKCDDLGHIAVRVLLAFHTFQILFFYQNVNALLNNLNFRLETRRQLIEDFSNQLCVVKHFAHLHDSDNGSLNEHFAILLNVLMSHFLFSLEFGL